MIKTTSSGIYWIKNKINGKIYVGSASNFCKRWYQHRRELYKGTHHSHHLQHAWNKYGENAFEFKILIVCDKSLIKWYEQQFLDQWMPEYNESKIASGGVMMGHMKGRFAGEKNPSAKLTLADVVQIKERLSQGETYLHISFDFPVSESMIGLISRGKKWNGY